MRARHLHVLLLAACASQTAEPPPIHTPPQSAASTPQRPPTPRCNPGGINIRATPAGIVLDLPPTGPSDPLTTTKARLLRHDDGLGVLYFFDLERPVLMRLHVGPMDHDTRTVLELPPLEHPGFPSSDPLVFLQRQEDLSITGHILCMDLHDRAEDPTLTYNVRIDLVAAKHERRLVEDLTGDRCGSEREAVSPRLCTPAGPSARDSEDGTCVYLGYAEVVPFTPTASRLHAE